MDYFVSRHPGALEWWHRKGATATILGYLDPAIVKPGDVVIGNLSVSMAAEVCARGGRYVHLVLDSGQALRGENLSADQMDALGAHLCEYIVTPAGEGGGHFTI